MIFCMMNWKNIYELNVIIGCLCVIERKLCVCILLCMVMFLKHVGLFAFECVVMNSYP